MGLHQTATPAGRFEQLEGGLDGIFTISRAKGLVENM